MAKTKQIARKSTGGINPRQQRQKRQQQQQHQQQQKPLKLKLKPKFEKTQKQIISATKTVNHPALNAAIVQGDTILYVVNGKNNWKGLNPLSVDYLGTLKPILVDSKLWVIYDDLSFGVRLTCPPMKFNMV